MRREHGQAAALTVLFLTVLMLSAAAVIDVGSWFREDRDTQRVADAAALAGAQALPEDQTTAEALAIEYAGKNGGGVLAADITFSTTVLPGDTINIDVDRPADSFFAKLVGIDSVEVGSTAKARAGVPSAARWAAPIVVDEDHPLLNCSPQPCFGQATELDLKKTGPGAFRLVNLDGSKGGTSPGTLADWMLRGYEGVMDLGWYYSDPGAKFNSSHMQAALEARIGDEVLFPIYRSVKGNGANLQYEIVGWVGFVMSDFDARGSSGKLYGHFTRVVWAGLLSTTSSGSTDFGVRTFALID